MKINLNDLSCDEHPFSLADYEAIRNIAIRNGGEISNDEIFSIINKGYCKLIRIKESLAKEGIIEKK